MCPGALTQLIRRVSTIGPNRWQVTANGCTWIARLEGGALVVVGKHSGLELPPTVPLHGTVTALVGDYLRHPSEKETAHV
ncbi:hypothetical protein [Corynebacterium aurimucosum]|uniref:hypothetical protein n=1 Tax=Corynebacterium aurimucosum TaxID=169292 RepID=UPI00187A0055|nr:hypothetical protein [Corynebacterium aurimucosum]MBE7338099.1 hypothetical protein [Corynebacterium aurimucosum]